MLYKRTCPTGGHVIQKNMLDDMFYGRTHFMGEHVLWVHCLTGGHLSRFCFTEGHVKQVDMFYRNKYFMGTKGHVLWEVMTYRRQCLAG